MNRDQRDPYGRIRYAAAAAGQSAKCRARQRTQPAPADIFDWDHAIELLHKTLAEVYRRRPR